MKMLIPLIFLFPILASAAGKIINADIAPAGAANIARNKMASGTNYAWCVNNSSGVLSDLSVTASRAVATDANGQPVASATTATELGYVNGVTSSIQTQLNGKLSAVSFAAFGSTPNSNGGSASGGTITLQPADASNPGGVSTAAQTFAGKKTFNGGMDAGSNKITSVTDPASAQDAATKNYVDTQLSYLNPAAKVYAASTANIAGTYTNAVSGVCVGDTFTVTATGALSMDGASPPSGSRVLLKNQASTFQNGVWTVTVVGSVGVSPVLTRALDFDTAADMSSGQIIPVVNGTVNAGSSWYQTNDISTCNSDAQSWTQFQKASSAYASSTLTSAHWLIGNSSNVATDVAMSGDASVTNAGAVTVGKVNGVTYPASPGTNTVPVVTSSNTITYETVPNAALANSSVTVNGTVCTLGSSCSPAASGSNANNMIYVDSGNGHGSTNTKVRRYSFVRQQVGALITYADSATNGASFTVATGGAGNYFMCAHEARAGAAVAAVGITVNGDQLTTSITTPITFAHGMRAAGVGTTNGQSTSACVVLALADADVVRVQDTGNEDGTDSRSSFMMVRLSDTGSAVYYNDGNGHGSGGTTTRRWTDARITNGGSDITYTGSSTNGDKFTAGTTGTYAICAGDTRSGGTLDSGITINSSSTSTNVSTISYANGKRTYMNGMSSGATFTDCLFIPLAVNDVIRLQDDSGAANDTSSLSFISIVKVGSLNNTQFVDTGNGHGSVETTRVLFSTLENNTGYGITVTNSSLAGTQFVAATAGVYAGCMNGYVNGGPEYLGIMYNGWRLPSTNIGTPIPFSDGARNIMLAGASSMGNQVCWAGYMNVGDNVSFADNVNTTTTNDLVMASFSAIQ